MKQGIHPDYSPTKVTCNGCSKVYEVGSTVDDFSVEICSNCHPFYTGKQKLVDVAGRVDRFKARQAAATDKQASKKTKAVKAKAVKSDSKEQLTKLKKQLSA